MDCHSVWNTGRSRGPALNGIGGRHSKHYIEAHISNTAANIKSTVYKGKPRMVQPDLFEDQVKSITSYLLTLPSIN